MEKQNISTALVYVPKRDISVKQKEVLFVSPAFSGNGNESVEWLKRNSNVIERILNGEVSQNAVVFK